MAQTRDRASMTAVFTGKYEGDKSDWGKHSGGGSNAHYTIEYRAFLENFIRLNQVRSIVDIGCGDWQFSRFLNLDGIHYRGFDLVESVIEQNSKRFETAHIEFAIMPEDYAALPGADLLIIKDVLQHLPNAQVLRFYSDVFPKYRACLITNSFRKLNTRANVDIRPGEFRCLDLKAAPYHFDGAYVFQFSSPLWEEIRTLLHMPRSQAE